MFLYPNYFHSFQYFIIPIFILTIIAAIIIIATTIITIIIVINSIIPFHFVQTYGFFLLNILIKRQIILLTSS